MPICAWCVGKCRYRRSRLLVRPATGRNGRLSEITSTGITSHRAGARARSSLPGTESFLMPYITESRFRVRYAETDQMGMVYYANYLVWMEVGRSDFCRECGFSYCE